MAFRPGLRNKVNSQASQQREKGSKKEAELSAQVAQLTPAALCRLQPPVAQLTSAALCRLQPPASATLQLQQQLSPAESQRQIHREVGIFERYIRAR